MSDLSENAKSIISQLGEWTSGSKTVSTISVSIFVLEVIKLVEIKSLSGEEKKKLALEVIDYVIRKYCDKNTVEIMETVPALIECFISIDKRKVVINNDEKVSRTCCGIL